MALSHTSSSIKMEAEIAGDPLPVIKATVSYEMNGIPFGTIVCPVGVDENKQPSPAHAVMKKTWPQPVKLTVDVKQLDTGEKRKHLPDGKYVIFDGYVSGSAVKRSGSGFIISFELTHWLSDLNHGSAMSAASHPDNPSRFSYSAVHKFRKGGTGGAGATKQWTSQTLAEGTFDQADVREDLWEKCILKWFKALAKEDRLGVEGNAGCDIGPNDSNQAVQKALDRFKNGDPPLKFLTEYPEGIEHMWDEFSNATFAATNNANGIASVSHSTIWDKLINSFAAHFSFSVIPFPESAKVVPFCPLLTDHWRVNRANSDYTIQSKDIDYLDFSQQVIRPIKGYMLYGGITFVTGVNLKGGSLKTNSSRFLGGCYIPDKGAPGMVIIKKLPRYLANVATPNRKTDNAVKVKATQVNPEEGDPGEDDGVKKRVEAAVNYAEKLAEFLYHNEHLKTRHGQLSGPLRFDICPGTTVKIEGVGRELNPEGTEITDKYAHVLRITHYIDAETPRAGTAFHLGHIHTDKEHGANAHTLEKHPLYTEKWNSKDCEGSSAPNGNEFACKSADSSQ